jgi:hypothetical protein
LFHQPEIVNPSRARRPTGEVMEMYRVETEFLNIVSMVAAQYDCVIENVDFKTRTVSLSCSGGKAQETKCALAISEIVEGSQEQPCFV